MNAGHHPEREEKYKDEMVETKMDKRKKQNI